MNPLRMHRMLVFVRTPQVRHYLGNSVFGENHDKNRDILSGLCISSKISNNRDSFTRGASASSRKHTRLTRGARSCACVKSSPYTDSGPLVNVLEPTPILPILLESDKLKWHSAWYTPHLESERSDYLGRNTRKHDLHRGATYSDPASMARSISSTSL